ncbi:unnamed protein product, partial [Meganyctiphanes norvegica]
IQSLTMYQLVSLLIVEAVVLAHLPIETYGDIITGEKTISSRCRHPFVDVGNRCYFFSENELSFDDASKYCEGLSEGQVFGITLAMFDYSRKEDQDLLDAIASMNGTFWIGGKSEDGNQWKWVDDRDVNLQKPFWFQDEPNQVENKCLIAQVHNFNAEHSRTLLFDNECGNSFKFICESGCPIHFRRLGDYCYMTSSDIGVPDLPWQEARDYCQALSVYEGYHADLVVLGLPGQDDYYLMQHLITSEAHDSWIGGVKQGEECKFQWIDGRELAIGSLYWRDEEPDCGDQDHVDLSCEMYTGEAYVKSNRRYINEHEGSIAQPFICQMFKDA